MSTAVRPPVVSGDAATEAQPDRVESREKRRQRLSTGALIGVIGVLLLVSLASTNGAARFALSNAFDEVQLPTVSVPGLATIAVCAILCLLAAAAFLPRRLRGRLPALAGTVAGTAVILSFLTWAGAGR